MKVVKVKNKKNKKIRFNRDTSQVDKPEVYFFVWKIILLNKNASQDVLLFLLTYI